MPRSEILSRLLESLGLFPTSRDQHAKQIYDDEDAGFSTSLNKPGQYAHEKLLNHDIRVLEIKKVIPAGCASEQQHQSDSAPDIICATLEHTSLHQDPDFVALSYTWGTLKADHPLYIGRSRLNITKNLHEALLHLYKANITRLWIDAVCINQADRDEKAKQILRLSRIFRAAREVIAWIGTHDKYTALISRCIENRSLKGILSGRDTDINMQLRTIFNELAKRPYWSRAWVVQEFAVAKQIRIMCGKDLADPNQVCQMISRYAPYNSNGVSPKESVVALARIRQWHQDGTNIGLLDLIRCTISLQEHCINRRVCRIFKSTDILDQIYSLLGLAIDGEKFVPEPSYDLEMNYLFMYMTKSIIASSGRLDFTLLEGGKDVSTAQDCGSTDKRSYNPAKLPSWCPDYLNLLDSHRNSELTYSLRFDTVKSPVYLLAISHRQRQPRLCWNATANSRLLQAEYTLYNSGSMLVPGMFVGRIIPCSEWEERFSSMLLTKRDNSSPYAWLDDLLSYYCCSSLPAPDPQNVLKALSFLLGDVIDGVDCCNDLKQKTRRRLITHRIRDDLAGYITDLLMKEPTSRAMLSAIPSEEVHLHAHDLGDSISINYEKFDRKIVAFDTSETVEQVASVAHHFGAYGWVPSTACQGDEIWLLKGCSMPVVLRRPFQLSGADSGVLLKIGPAVVNGAMDGGMWLEGALETIKIVKS